MLPTKLTNRIWTDSGVFTWQNLLDQALAHISEINTSGAFACVVDTPLEALKWVVLGVIHELNFAILGRERLTDSVRSTLFEAGLGLVDELPRECIRDVHGAVWILTSGSTGSPKLIQHTWDTLLTQKRSPAPHRWLLPFQIGTYAWYQIVLPSICFDDQDLVVPSGGSDVASILSIGNRFYADAISSTPTFWHVALMTMQEAKLRELQFKQISLGGEIVDQAILNQLSELYPGAKITHIYAATEVGACIVVNDGLAGFPAAFLEDSKRSISLADRDGVLWVRSSKRGQNKNLADQDDWICTGDLIERSGDRVYFKGRAGRQLINVGGQKAYPADIESVLLSHPAIRWCRVSARRAPLVGNLVSADVVLMPGWDQLSAENALSEFCQTRLAEYAVPRFFNFHTTIPFTGNLKSSL